MLQNYLLLLKTMLYIQVLNIFKCFTLHFVLSNTEKLGIFFELNFQYFYHFKETSFIFLMLQFLQRLFLFWWDYVAYYCIIIIRSLIIIYKIEYNTIIYFLKQKLQNFMALKSIFTFNLLCKDFFFCSSLNSISLNAANACS